MADRSGRQARLILVMGTAGAGKSTLAVALARRIGALYLNSDDVAGAFCGEDRESPAYLGLRPRMHAAIYAIAAANLALGSDVILDMPHVSDMADPSWRERMVALAGERGGRLLVIVCRCPPDELRRRIEVRGAERDRCKLAAWDGHLSRFPPDFPVPLPHLQLDTQGTEVDALLARAISYIDHDANPGSA